MGPQIAFLSPRKPSPPRNTHARFDVPRGPGSRTYVLRAHRGAVVPSKVDVVAGAELDTIDIAPLAPLAASTRYEVAIVEPNEHPSTLVVGTFVTGTEIDVAAPTMPSLVALSNHLNLGRVDGGMCSVRGPWITFEQRSARDPGREGAELAFKIWRISNGLPFDPKRPPDALLVPFRDHVVIGASNLCAPHPFDLSGAIADLAVVAVDEAGNESAVRRARVALRSPSP